MNVMLMSCLIFNFSSVGCCCISNSEFYVGKLAVEKLAARKLALQMKLYKCPMFHHSHMFSYKICNISLLFQTL